MLTSLRKLALTFALLIATYSLVLAQATVTVDQKKDACNGLFNGSVRLTVTAGTGPFTYFMFGLSNGSGPFIGPLTMGVPTTVNNLPPDNYLLSITDGDPNPNFNTTVIINNITSALAVTVDPGFPINNTNCAAPTGQIAITPTGGTGIYSFSWTATNGFTSTTEDITGLPGGTYSVTVSDQGTNCTVSLGSIVITDPSPTIQTVTTPSPQTVCTGSNATISLANTEVNPVTYEVLINGAPSGVTAPGPGGPLTLNVPFALLSNGDVLTVRATNGICTPVNMNGAVTVSIVPLPVPPLAGPTTVCAASTGNVYTTSPGQSNYVWTVSAGGTITAGGGAANNTVTVTWTTAGARSVSVSYTNTSGCVAAAPTNLPVTVNPQPVPTITGPASVCVGSTSNVYTTEAGQSNYAWTVSAGGTITAGGSATDNTVTVTWTTTGAKTVTVNYSNSFGCTASTPTTQNVTVNPLPVPLLTGGTSVCLNSTGNVYTTDAAQTNYVWTVSAGGTITAGGTATDNTVTVTWTTTGAKTVSVSYTDASGCTAAAPTVLNVTVNPLPTPTLVGTTTVCEGTTGVVYTTEAGQTNYVWNVSGGGTITAGGNATSNTVTVTWNTAGAQTVSVNYDNAFGCDALAPTVINVTVNPRPVPTLTGPAAPCVNSTGNVYTTDPGQTNYVWVVSAGGTVTAGGNATSNTVTVTWTTTGARSVTVSYTDANGCTPVTPTVQNVTVNPLPVPGLTGTTTVCAGTTGVVYTTDAGMASYSWVVSAGGTITAGGTATDNTVTVTWNTAGARSVSVNYINGNGCTAATPTVLPVTVNTTPVPTITGSNSVCAGATGVVYTTEAGQTNYAWVVSGGGTITAGGTATDNTVTITWNTAGAQTVSVNYSNAFGCAAATPTVSNVTVNALPAPTLGGPTSACVGSTGNVYTTEAGQTNYVWVVSAGGTITAGGGTTNNTVTVTWNTAGARTVSVNYTNAAGCTAATATVTNVTVNAVPTPALGGPTTVCAASTGNVYTTDVAQTNYVWVVSAGGTITAGGTATDNTVTVTWNTAGARTVSVNYTNAAGCSAPSPTSLGVTVNPLPLPTISGSNSVCVGATGVVYITEAGRTNYVWTVSGGGTITAGGTATDNTATVTWNTAGAQTVSVSYTDANGCTPATPTVRAVTVNALPAPTVTGPLNVCAGSTGNVYTTEAGQTNYVWVVSAGGTITAGGSIISNTVTVTWNTAGARTVSVNYTNAAGCTAVSPTVANVTVNAVPTPSLAGPTAVCAGSTGNVYTTDATQTNYVWVVSPGGTITAGGTATDNTVTVTWNTAGARTVSVNYTNAAGCAAPTATVSSVTVSPLPVPTITGSNNVCAGATNVVYTTEAARTNYVWTVSGGGTITAGGTATDNTVTVTWNTAGAQTVSVSYSDASGCIPATPTIRNVTVNAIPVPTLAGPAAACAGSITNVYTTETGQTNYVWVVSAGGTITAGGNATSNTVTVTWNTAGAQTVSVNYTNAAGCVASLPTIFNVTIDPVPTPTLTGPVTVCEGTTGNVYTTEAGQNNYVWTVSGGGTITAGGTATDNTVTVTWTGTGAQSVTVNYSTAAGCTAATATSQGVTVNPLPVPSLTGSPAVCTGTTGLVYTTDAGMTNYTWVVSGGGTITAGGGTGDNTVTITWNTAGAQTVTVNYTDANGCSATTPTVFNVNVNNILVPTLTGSTAVCVGTSGVVYTSDPGQSNYVWNVSAGGTITAGGTATDNSVTVTWNTAGPQTVDVTYTDVNGCSVPAPTVLNVSVGTVPTPTLLGSNVECEGATTVVYTTDSGQSNYVWNVSSGGTITAGGSAADNTVTVTWTTPGAQTVSVNYTSSGCTAATPTVLNVTVNALPTPTLTGSTDACQGSTGEVYTTEAGQTNYVWTVSGGGTITAGGTATDNTVTITWATAGAQTVSVNYTNAAGCTATAAVVSNVTVNALPVPTLTGTTTACQGESVIYSTEAAQTNYVWTVSAGATITAGGTATDNTVTITWTGTGPQSVSVNYTDASGCTAAVATLSNVTVNPVTVPTLGGSTTVCVSATSEVYTTQAGQSNYVWNISGGGTITAGGTAADNTVSVTWNAAGAQTVSVNFDNGSGCSAATPTVLNVTVNDIPTAQISGTPNICIGQTTNLAVVLTGGGPWDIVYTDGSSNFNMNGIVTSPASIPVSPFITTSYSLVSVNNASCGAGTVSGSATVTVNPIPGNPATFGVETWLGYVYDDSGDLATPLPGRINFIASKYRGFIDETDIDNMSGTSTYDATTDEFNLDPATASVFGPNVCGTFADDFSLRMRMRKTFVAGIYNFAVGSDDGVRLFIDGTNVLAAGAFGTHAYQVFNANGICLTAGTHDIVIEYFERGGFSRISFDYDLAPSPVVTSPVTICINSAAPALTASSPDAAVTGFKWYADAGLTTLVASTAGYTPAVPAELDVTVAGTTDFFVTAVYGCGETPASQVDVVVVNSAALTLNDTTVCEAGGVVDLTTLVGAVPPGGTFTFAGTSVTGNNFDPTGLSGPITITVDYISGTCAAPQGTFNITVTNSSSVTVPSTPITVCESGADVDLTTLVTGSPGGGTFTFAGTGVTGNMFDPSTLSGPQTITVDYTVGGCPAPQTTFTITVSPNASITPINGNVCQNAGVQDLLARVSGSPGGGIFTFSGTGVTGTNFNPTGLTGPINIAVTYTVAGCSVANSTLVLTVLDPSNPSCGGGGVNCFAFTINDDTSITSRPTCSNQDDGVIALDITTVSGGNIIVQLISPTDTVTQIKPTGSKFVFSSLSPANYKVKVADVMGNICIQPFSLPLQTIVNATADATSFVDVACFGQPVGQAVINATGSSTGQYFYSVNGTKWTLFVPGNVISDLPPNGTYNVLIGESINDACSDTVKVVINNINPAIVVDNITIEPATCNGNDGRISGFTALGGSGGPFTFSIDGISYKSENDFPYLPGGNDTLYVKDASGCIYKQPFTITFPGFVEFQYFVKNADCDEAGKITVDITDTTQGSYSIGVSTDPLVEPAQYQHYSGAPIPFPDKDRGTYYVFVRSTGAACPTISPPIEIGGVQAIRFDVGYGCTAGNSSDIDKPVLRLNNITLKGNGAPAPLYYVWKGGILMTSLTGDPVLHYTEGDTRLEFDYDSYAFMQTPGDDYEIMIEQFDNSVLCPVKSLKVPFVVPRRLTASIGLLTESYPDIPTGTMQVRLFDGGMQPYDIRIELDSAASFELAAFETNYEEVGLNSNSQFEKIYKNIPAGRYLVQVKDTVGCFIQRIARVPLDTDIFIPNIFTPNEDGKNDVFYVRNLPTSSKLIITNRWGKEVYSTSDYKNDWKGDGVGDGIYFYRLQGSEGSSVSGWVEVLRGDKP